MSTDNQDRFQRVFNLRSGFTIGVKPLPPYYMDVVEMVYPLLDLPKREITLLAGDKYYESYKMPEEPPDEHSDDYELYVKTKYVNERNEEIKQLRQRARRDLLLSTCIEILDGPEEYTDEHWVQELEAPFTDQDFQVSEHEGFRRLLFIKMRVLTDTQDAANAQQAALYQEVSEQGISDALRGFRHQVGRGTVAGSVG